MKVLLVGHRGHQEVRGTMGQVEMTLVSDQLDSELPEWDPSEQVAVLTQTTLSVRDTARAIDAIQDRFYNAVVRNDICYATTNRQTAVTHMAALVELVLVIGAENSSNCNRLREVAEAQGVPSYLINGPEEIDPSWILEVEKVGITSGASTPEVLVESVIQALAPEKVTMLDGVAEDVAFTLPRELR
jgi:4-hydroxy-3-methylbut-2-enyl diphosphate reductase